MQAVAAFGLYTFRFGLFAGANHDSKRFSSAGALISGVQFSVRPIFVGLAKPEAGPGSREKAQSFVLTTRCCTLCVAQIHTHTRTHKRSE